MSSAICRAVWVTSLILILAVFVIFGGEAPNLGVRSSGGKYDTYMGAFQIDFPENWRVGEGDEGIVGFTPPAMNARLFVIDEETATATVRLANLDIKSFGRREADFNTFNKKIVLYERDICVGPEGKVDVNRDSEPFASPATATGAAAWRGYITEFTYHKSGEIEGDLHLRVVVLETGGGQRWVIEAETELAWWDTYSGYFDHMIDSFTPQGGA